MEKESASLILTAENIPQAINLFEKIKKKKAELEELEAKLSIFKMKMIEKLKKEGLESVRKNGYNFTLVCSSRTVFNEQNALEIIKNSGNDVNDFLSIDEKKFQKKFGIPENVFEKVAGSEYLRITKVS